MKYTMIAAAFAGAVMAGGLAAPAMADEGPEPAPAVSAQEITEAMQQVCEVVPMDHDQCLNYVDVYGGLVINLIEQDLSPQEIAAALGLRS
ncbi:saposin domain-containing protein [Streptomyces sp900105245]|uniref:saposin domain-containing protein n=1 Tax=Streptomyces sp. 900105245 TaxID=3154379 RepID=UPI0033193B36